MPAEAKGTTEKSAKAFVRYYFTLLNYATRTGDTRALRAVTTQECESCINFERRIERIYDVGGQIRGDGWELQSAAPVTGQPVSEPILQLGMQLHPQTVLMKRGGEEEHFEGGQQPMTMYLVRPSGHWMVRTLDLVV